MHLSAPSRRPARSASVSSVSHLCQSASTNTHTAATAVGGPSQARSAPSLRPGWSAPTPPSVTSVYLMPPTHAVATTVRGASLTLSAPLLGSARSAASVSCVSLLPPTWTTATAVRGPSLSGHCQLHHFSQLRQLDQLHQSPPSVCFHRNTQQQQQWVGALWHRELRHFGQLRQLGQLRRLGLSRPSVCFQQHR